jgi:hypothetical protein
MRAAVAPVVEWFAFVPVTRCPACGLSLPEDHTCTTPTTGPETPVTTFEDLAPYPDSDAEGAAEKLARNYTVLAQANFVRSMDGATPEIRHQGTANLIGMYSVVLLLRFLSDFHRDVADDAARDLLEELDAPESIGPQIYQWLTEYGIRPERVDAITRNLPEPSQDKPAVEPTEVTV